jgi:transposase InsO family protein
LKHLEALEMLETHFQAFQGLQDVSRVHFLSKIKGFKRFKQFDILLMRGIEHQLMMPGSPQQNGKAERFNRTIINKAMAMLHTAGLPNGFWEFAVSMAAHIYNHTPSHTLKW